MFRLTKQEQIVLVTVLALLFIGWMVKVYRTAHPPVALQSATSP